MARVRVTSPDGTPGSIDASQYEAAVQAGYKPITEASEYANSVPGMVASAGAGILRGVTAGLSDAWVKEEGGDVGLLQTMREENPIISGVADIGGNVVGIGKFLGKLPVVAGMALQGLTPVITENVLEGKEITASNIGARLIGGALLGKGASVAGNGIVKGANAITGAASKLAASEAVAGAAEKLSEKAYKAAVGDLSSALKGEGVGKSSDEILKWARDNRLLGVDHNATAELARGRAQDAKNALGDLFEQLGNSHPEAGPLLAKAAPLVETAEGRATLRGILEAEEGSLFPKGTAAIIEAHADDLARASALQNAALKRSAESEFKMSDAIGLGTLGAVFSGRLGAAVKAPLMGYVAGKMKNEGGYLLGKALDQAAEGELLPRIADAFKARVDSMLSMAPGMLGPFATALSAASARGAGELLATHAGLASGPQGDKYLATMGTPRGGDDDSHVPERLDALQQLTRAYAEQQRSTEKALNKFISRQDIEYPEPASFGTKEDLDSHVKVLQDILNNPAKLNDHIPPALQKHAPGLSIAAGVNAGAVAKFLLERAPKPDDLWKPKALQAPHDASQEDVDRWFRYMHAATDPSTLVRELASGDIHPQTVEAVKTLHPAVYQDLQMKILAKMQELEHISYDKKLKLASAFGDEIMGLTNDQILLLQDAATPKPDQNSGGAPQTDGRQVVNTNKNEETQTQRLENRRNL